MDHEITPFRSGKGSGRQARLVFASPNTSRKTAAQQTHKIGEMKNVQMTKNDAGRKENRADKRTASQAARPSRENSENLLAKRDKINHALQGHAWERSGQRREDASLKNDESRSACAHTSSPHARRAHGSRH